MGTSTAGTETVALLRTKLHMPRLSDDLIERPHLLTHLDRGLDRKLTLVSAPAGYGKTTLVVAWLQNSSRSVAWLSLDKHDNDLLGFLNYFVAAIQTIFPTACPQTASLEQLPQLPALDFVAATLTNELAILPDDFVVALDDYHLVRDSSINQLLTELLAHAPLQMHLVITTRIDPPLPLAKLRVQQQLTEIRRTQLSFTVDEVHSHLANTMNQRLPRETAALLQERTEGWVAGLRMAVLSMRGQSDPAAFVQGFSGSQRHVMAYLMDEVMGQQPPEVQEFLLQTSILSRFCVALGGAVSGNSPKQSQEIIERLEQANLFMVPLDDEHDWFRYHHLFQEMLNRRLQARLSQEAIAELHNRAGAWLVNQGNIAEALHHALAAHNVASAVQLIEQSRHDLLNRENWYALERLLNALPAEIESKYAGLLVARAWTLVMRLSLPPVAHLLEEAEYRLAQDSSTYTEPELICLVGEIDAIRSMCGSWQGLDMNSVIEYCERAVECIPTEHHRAHVCSRHRLWASWQCPCASRAKQDRVSPAERLH
jgi:LuxR family maltose regulon positive regulatory protein